MGKEILNDTLENTEAEIGDLNADLELETAKHNLVSNKLTAKLSEERSKQTNRLKERLARKRAKMLERGELQKEELAAQQEADEELANELIRTVEDREEVSTDMLSINEEFDGEKKSLIKSLEHETKSQREKLKARLAARKAKHKGKGKKDSKKASGGELHKVQATLSQIYSQGVAAMQDSSKDPKAVLQQLLIDLAHVDGVVPQKEAKPSGQASKEEMRRKLKEKLAANPELAK